MLKSLWTDLATWWSAVTPEFAFLLALPFMVAAAGFLGECIRRCLAWRRRCAQGSHGA
jgi:hypothetical protein